MTSPHAVVDLRPYACPLTYVKTRIALERLAEGERLELWLAGGEPVESLPRSAEEDGHRILSIEPLGQAEYRVVIEKGAGRPEVLP